MDVQTLDTHLSTSSEADDPLGMQHLFEEQPSGNSSNVLASDAATPTGPVCQWTPVLRLSLQCLITWLHASKQSFVGLQSQHLDAVLYLVDQSTAPKASGFADAQPAADSDQSPAFDSNDAHQLAIADLLQSLHSALLGAVPAFDDSACGHIVSKVLMSPTRDFRVSSAHSSGNLSGHGNRVVQLAATCLMHNAQACLAGHQDPQLVLGLWTDLIVSASQHGSALAESDVTWRLAQPR